MLAAGRERECVSRPFVRDVCSVARSDRYIPLKILKLLGIGTYEQLVLFASPVLTYSKDLYFKFKFILFLLLLFIGTVLLLL